VANVQLKGGTAFRYLDVTLAPGESIVTESGAMASMASELDLTSKFNGGFFVGLARALLGGESLFINTYSNPSDRPRQLTLTAPLPGDVGSVTLAEGESICLESGAYICSTPGVRLSLRFAGFTSFIAREGLFKLVMHGPGTVWFGSYGAIEERQISGEVIVDSGHLIGYDPQVRLKLQLSSGIVGSFLSGEGLVTRVEGNGRMFIQTRSVTGLAAWANSKMI
jgi:uncharacterized protein (TIGR00266 family)